MELLFLLIPLSPFLVVRLTKNWRQTLFLVMVLLVLEGAIRKWVLPQFQAQIYFVKDALLVLAVVGFALERRATGGHVALQSGLRFWLFAYFVFCSLQIINSNNPSMLLWVVGFKSHLLYIALMFLVPYAFNSMDELERVSRLYAICMIPLVAVGLVQFFAPSDSVLNMQVSHDVDAGGATIVAVFGADNRARASGTFAYIGGYATFITTMFLFALPAVVVVEDKLLRNWPAFLLLILSATCSFTTGSRTVILTTLGVLPVVLILYLRAGVIKGGTVGRIAVGGGLALLVISLVALDAVDAMSHRSANSDDPIVRLMSPFYELYLAFDAAPLFGTGLGTNHNSSTSIMQSQILWWLGGHLYELETARIMQECGIFGFSIVYGLRVYLIVLSIQMALRFRRPKCKAIAMSIATYGIIHVFLFVVNNPSAGLYYWFSIGLLFAMYRLEAHEANGGGTMVIPASRLDGRVALR